MMRKEQNIYTSQLLNNLGIVHGYSTRYFGDLRRDKNKDKFLDVLGLKRADVVIGEQVHGTRFVHVTEGDRGKKLTGIDGLVAKDIRIVLGVTFADCVPLLAVDPKAKVIGTAHAGWKGTLAGIARELVHEMKAAGADDKNIYVSVGPHIGMCSYDVTEDRIMAFRNTFGGEERITAKIMGEWHLDIGYANYQLLRDSGIQKTHIDAPPTCTACQVAEFNSFRADPEDAFGVQLGVITL